MDNKNEVNSFVSFALRLRESNPDYEYAFGTPDDVFPIGDSRIGRDGIGNRIWLLFKSLRSLMQSGDMQHVVTDKGISCWHAEWTIDNEEDQHPKEIKCNYLIFKNHEPIGEDYIEQVSLFVDGFKIHADPRLKILSVKQK